MSRQQRGPAAGRPRRAGRRRAGGRAPRQTPRHALERLGGARPRASRSGSYSMRTLPVTVLPLTARTPGTARIADSTAGPLRLSHGTG